MIVKGSQRGGGQDLATHLKNERDNDRVRVFGVRGAIAESLHEAFQEWEVTAHSLTRCREYLYSLSINPDPGQDPLTEDQYMDYIERAEVALGLAGQPRAVIFHEKFGREHCHVVWSRVDAENGRAVHLAYDHDKLMRVTRAFARDHGLALPEGYKQSQQVGQISLYENDQARKTGLIKEDHIREITQAWQQHDDPKAFVHALAERGYILATGKRPYVLVDLYGGMHALAKMIDDKQVRTTDLRKFLGADFPPESLPSVEDAKALVALHRTMIERSVDQDRLATELSSLKQAQDERRQASEKASGDLRAKHQHDRLVQQSRHRLERDSLRTRHRQEMQAIRKRRFENRPTGLAAFLGRISGVALIQTIRARRADTRLLKTYLEDKAQLAATQKAEREGLEVRQALQAKVTDRDLKSLAKIDARERSSLRRDETAQQRTHDRADQGIPSVRPALATLRQRPEVEPSRDFNLANGRKFKHRVDISSVFWQAASDHGQRGREGQASETPTDSQSGRPTQDHEKER